MWNVIFGRGVGVGGRGFGVDRDEQASVEKKNHTLSSIILQPNLISIQKKNNPAKNI